MAGQKDKKRPTNSGLSHHFGSALEQFQPEPLLGDGNYPEAGFDQQTFAKIKELASSEGITPIQFISEIVKEHLKANLVNSDPGKAVISNQIPSKSYPSKMEFGTSATNQRYPRKFVDPADMITPEEDLRDLNS